MKLVGTIKIKTNLNQQLRDMSGVFLRSVQYAIDKGFEAKISNRFKLHYLVYRDLRQWLPADFACEAITKASENLRSVKLKKRPVMKSCPITFNRNLFTFSFDKVRLATFIKGKRQDVPIVVPEYYWKYLDWRYQTLELIQDRKGRMFFHITFSREVDVDTSCANEKVGIDLGVNNLAVTSNGDIFKAPKTKIIQFQYLRKRLQRKGTKSAKRRLKLFSGRQKRYMRDVNHVVSKQIVKSGDVFALEDLKGFRRSATRFKHTKRLNRWLNNWSYAQLRTFITYKAEREGKRVVLVNPYLSSQECSSCNRLGSRYSSSFVCNHCGLSLNADLNASFNLRRRIVNSPIVACDDTSTVPNGLLVEHSYKPHRLR